MSVPPSERGEQRPAFIKGVPVENIPPGSLIETHLERYVPGLTRLEDGKVGENYRYQNSEGTAYIVTVRTDFNSTGDERRCAIPLSGMVLTGISEMWKRRIQARGVLKTDLVGVPHPNVTIARMASPDEILDYEVILRERNVRTPSSTSVYQMLQKGNMAPYGIKFEPGDIPGPNEPFPSHMGREGILFTPTTKAKRKGEHDRPVTEEEFRRGVDTKFGWGASHAIINIAHAEYGEARAKALQSGVIMPDTKLEIAFIKGNFVVIDEAFTPHSSRYWDGETYQDRIKQGHDPIDESKESLRVEVVEARQRQGLPEGATPILTGEALARIQEKYLGLYKRLMGQDLFVDSSRITQDEVIASSVGSFLQSHFNQRSS